MSYDATQRKREIRAFITLLKANTGCHDCKNYFPAAVIEYDHIGKHKKRACIARMVNDGLGLKTIIKEIQKCEPVCANCHRLRTTKRKLN